MPRRSGRRLLHLLAAAALTVTAAVTASAHSAASAAPGSPALTPPSGWNSWNSFGCGITEAQVRQAADAMVSSGMRDAGYRYVVVDDCWFDPQRDAAGDLRADPAKFPSGTKALGDYIHSKGLKVGIHQAPGERTCAQAVGSYPGSTGSKGHEAQDAATFASWGVDYLKYDWCSPSGTRDEQVARFTLMGDALRATGRQIVYSISPNSLHAPTGATFNWGEVADLWRTTEDLLDSWQNGNTKTTNGTRVVTRPCNGQNNQKWTVGSDGSIRNAHAGLCLDVDRAGTANGTPLVLWTCNGQANQRWTRA